MTRPEGVLGAIVARKRSDVAARLGAARVEDLRSRAEPTRRSLRAALARPGARFILEVKRVSPSEGPLRAAADPAAIARAYRSTADAISVLTDAPYFGGSLEDLRAVRAEYAGPILAKDFIVDPRQVVEARSHGADAVLAMLSVLDDREAAAVIAEAARLGMDTLVEAHDASEVRRAVALGAAIIGINNRDLRTLKIDLATTERLAGLVPPDRLIVAESGIGGRADVERLSAHADAFLVGSALMRAEDPALAARVLAFGRVKICGLTREDDLEAACESGASYAGMILVPGTPRAVSRAQAESLAATGAGIGLPMVGVFRDERIDYVADAARGLGLRAVQLHGAEDGGYIAALRALLPEGCEIWAAEPVGEGAPAPRPGADRALFDTDAGGRSGGTGRVFDWTKVRGRADLRRALLAGGLDATNARAASRLGAFALDVGSGVEAVPGRKDGSKLHALFEALRLPVRNEAARCG